MLKRVLTAVVLIAVMALGIWLQGWFLRAILLVIMLACTWEVYHALRIAGQRPAEWTGYLFCALAATAQAIAAVVPGGGFGRMLVAVGPPAFALTVGVLVAMAVIILRGKVDFEAMQSTLFPMVYPGLFFCLILGLQDLHDPAAATLALVLTFFVASVNDTFALFVGVKFGRHRLSPEISPKKSVEGSVAGLVASVLFALLAAAVAAKVAPGAPLPPLWAFGLLGLVAGGLSQIGDLVASLVKRHCGIKDFSNIFPGHGGMLDRLDGILFCGAACWLFFKAFGF